MSRFKIVLEFKQLLDFKFSDQFFSHHFVNSSFHVIYAITHSEESFSHYSMFTILNLNQLFFKFLNPIIISD